MTIMRCLPHGPLLVVSSLVATFFTLHASVLDGDFSWQEIHRLRDEGFGHETYTFGESIAAADPYVVVGSTSSNMWKGQATVYAQALKTGLSPIAVLKDDTGIVHDQFGASVGINALREIVVGAPRRREQTKIPPIVSSERRPGSAFIFAASPSDGAYAAPQFSLSATLVPPRSYADTISHFGRRVAIDGDSVAVASEAWRAGFTATNIRGTHWFTETTEGDGLPSDVVFIFSRRNETYLSDTSTLLGLQPFVFTQALSTADIPGRGVVDLGYEDESAGRNQDLRFGEQIVMWHDEARSAPEVRNEWLAVGVAPRTYDLEDVWNSSVSLGAVYVYRYDASLDSGADTSSSGDTPYTTLHRSSYRRWHCVQILRPPGARFIGGAIGAHNDLLVIGDIGRWPIGNYSAVHIYRLNASGLWDYEAVLDTPGNLEFSPAFFAGFAASTAVHNDTIVVGAPGWINVQPTFSAASSASAVVPLGGNDFADSDDSPPYRSALEAAVAVANRTSGAIYVYFNAGDSVTPHWIGVQRLFVGLSNDNDAFGSAFVLTGSNYGTTLLCLSQYSAPSYRLSAGELTLWRVTQNISASLSSIDCPLQSAAATVNVTLTCYVHALSAGGVAAGTPSDVVGLTVALTAGDLESPIVYMEVGLFAFNVSFGASGSHTVSVSLHGESVGSTTVTVVGPPDASAASLACDAPSVEAGFEIMCSVSYGPAHADLLPYLLPVAVNSAAPELATERYCTMKGLYFPPRFAVMTTPLSFVSDGVFRFGVTPTSYGMYSVALFHGELPLPTVTFFLAVQATPNTTNSFISCPSPVAPGRKLTCIGHLLGGGFGAYTGEASLLTSYLAFSALWMSGVQAGQELNVTVAFDRVGAFKLTLKPAVEGEFRLSMNLGGAAIERFAAVSVQRFVEKCGTAPEATTTSILINHHFKVRHCKEAFFVSLYVSFCASLCFAICLLC